MAQADKIYTIDEIEFRNSDYLLNKILNDNKYIIINTDLWRLLCTKGKEQIQPINYSMNYSQIKFTLNDQKELIFSNHEKNNLLGKKYFYSVDNLHYKNFISSFEKIIDNAYKPIKDYYEFHKNFIANLKANRGKLFNGFLIDIDWFENWEKFYDYNNIKFNYLDKNATKKEIIDYLIYFIHANKKNINELLEPEIYQFSSTNEIISCIRNKKLIIVNSSLLISSKNLQNKLTYFNLEKNNIKINFNDGPSFSINISGNIISLKNDDNEQNQNLIGHYNKNKDNIFDEYNLESKCQNIFINQNFAIPPLIGLDNIEATCYMNATLQCLCNIPKFVNFFKYNKHLIEYVKNDLVCGNARLSSSFKLLIEKLWPDRQNFPSSGKNNAFSNKKNESYAPKEFKEKISKMNSLFKVIRVNDPKDLLNFLIMTLHTELNIAYKNNMNNNSIILDQTNQQLMFQIFSENFMENNQSIISDLFYGVNYNVIQCQGCISKSYNFQIFFYFEFPLKKVRIFK